jgi:MFS family permease
MLQGWFGGIFALSSAIGPLVGGVFTDQITWRWVVSFMKVYAYTYMPLIDHDSFTLIYQLVLSHFSLFYSVSLHNPSLDQSKRSCARLTILVLSSYSPV